MFKLSIAFAVSSVVGQTLSGYCAGLESNCNGTFGINQTACMQAFANIDPGTLADENKNTLGCRMKYLNTSCRFAGPTGGGRCGSVLENVCNISTTTCNGTVESSYPNYADCVTGLSSIGAQWGSAQGSNADGENSLECRVYHAIVSMKFGATHCGHYNLTSPACPLSSVVKPNSTTYCQTLQYNCNGTGVTQFGSEAICSATAMGYPTSLTDSAVAINTNTLGCRQYHAQAALSDPTLHCKHAGPSGGGVCGTSSQAWGNMANKACNDTSVSLLAVTLGAAIDTVVAPGSAPYSVLEASGNTQACRIYHLSVAAIDPATHCTHGSVIGGGVCGPVVGNLCDMIEKVCTFGNNATYQFQTKTACMNGLQNVTMGTAGASSGDSLNCRYYHVGVAAMYLTAAMENSTNGTMAQNNVITHCSHVLAAATAGCTGSAMTPTPAAASSATSLSLLLPALIAVGSFMGL